MAYALGVALFALTILISVSLHEAGHMAAAKAFGMKVTRYFVGFGPTLWSFRRGETEYGVKGIPLGGFVKIVGMTQQDDDVDPKDEPRAMWRFALWKRTVVMSAGSITHFLLAFGLLWLSAMIIGLPNPDAAKYAEGPYVRVQPCVIQQSEVRACQPGDPASPAAKAGLKDGDKITQINGASITTYEELVRQIRATKPGPAQISYEREGRTETVQADLAAVQRPPVEQPDGAVSTVAALGVSGGGLPPGVPGLIKHGPIGAVGASADYTGEMAVATVDALKRFPEKIPRLWAALSGEERDADTPISVVGASRLGGEAVENNAWALFISLLITLNFFIGVFNLLPILPLDGGHIAIAFFERIRSWLYARIGRADPGRVDYYKLMPLTYAIIFIFGGFTLLTVAADIINPITLFR
jgi:membrane-associated protease RseP (regulator of RpoE activity)